MKTIHTILRTLAALAVLLILTAVPASAQTALNFTTLSNALTDTSGTLVTVASATGIQAQGTGANTTFIYLGGEAMLVRTVTSTTLQVVRGANGTRATTHLANEFIYVAPPAALTTVDFGGACVPANYPYLPIINVRSGNVWNCVPTTSALSAAQGGVAVGATSVWAAWNQVPIQESRPRTAVAAQAYTILPTDYVVALTTTSAGVSMRSFTLPSHVGLAGKHLIIKDESGGISSTTGIVLIGTIDGTNSSVTTVIQMKTAFQSVGLYAGSGGWFTLWCSGAGTGILSWGVMSGCR